MKRVINGKTYDTETATRLTTGDHGHELSQAWWSLYRTSQGAFFEVVAGHDGVVEGFRPVTDAEARTVLEADANHLVEKYFGPMPEAGASDRRFSRLTVIAAIGVIERLTQAKLTRFFYELGPEFPRWTGNETQSVTKRLNKLIDLYDQRPERLLEEGKPLPDVLVEKAVSLLVPGVEPGNNEQEFRRRLKIDGFVITDGELHRALPDDLQLPAAKDELSRLLKKHKFTVPQGHLDQALDAHARGKWAAANSQIRTFLESLFDEIAARLDPAANAGVAPGQARRQFLANFVPTFFDRTLNEWGDNGVGFVNGLMARLHPQGSHPGLSGDEDSTFRLHIVLLTARLMLVRFNNRVTS